MTIHEAYRDYFLSLLEKGMTHADAYKQFCPVTLSRATYAEVCDGYVWFDGDADKIQTADGLQSLTELTCEAIRQIYSKEDMNHAIDIWLEGWTKLYLTPESALVRWKWIRHPKTPHL